MTARLLIGDVFERMVQLEDHSFDLIITSPPFLALRSYLPDGHPDKAKEIGSEATPAEYLDTLLRLTAEWRRLLAPHGSLAVELGDTYAGSGGAGGDYGEDGLRAGQAKFDGSNQRMRRSPPGSGTGGDIRFTVDGKGGTGWPLDKSLTGIPTLYAWSLAYGRNLLTGQPSPAGQWRIRNLKPWIRSNPPVGALADKERPATSYITVATLARDRYFDLDSARRGSLGPTGTASGAVLGVANAHIVSTTLETDGRPPLRGWCKPGKSKIAVSPSVTWQAQRLQVVEPVGFLMGVEEVVGPKMVDLQATVAPTAAAAVAVAVEGLFAGSMPVAAPVGGTTAVPAGVVLASDIDAPPLAGTLEAAEVVGEDLALVAGEWLAARIALKLNGANATAYAITPLLGAELASGHSEQSSSNHHSAGAPPLDWWHHIDAIIDDEIDRRAGKPSKRNDVGAKRRKTLEGGEMGPYDGGTVGARGVHIRRRLEQAGILTTLDAYDISPKGYSGMTRPTTRLVPCGPHDGGQRTTSRGCPVHGDRPAPASTAPDDEHADSPATCTPHSSDGHVQGQLDDSAPTALRTELTTELPNSDLPPQLCAPAATPHSTVANRTALVPSTSPVGTPSVEMTDRTARTPASPSSGELHLDMLENRNDGADRPSPESETDDGTAHTSDPLAACTCSYHLAVKDEESTSHYAVWPPELVRQLIDEMCPRRVCTVCGEPSRRITDAVPLVTHRMDNAAASETRGSGGDNDPTRIRVHDYSRSTTGWSECDCPEFVGPGSSRPEVVCSSGSQGNTPGPTPTQFEPTPHVCQFCDRPFPPNGEECPCQTNPALNANIQNLSTNPSLVAGNLTVTASNSMIIGKPKWRPGRILDPFVGSGTTLAVASGMGRDSVGIDLDSRSADLALQRVGMFLEVDYGTSEVL